ncbi:hypothetical protein NQ318_007810 [Aromia moschata]|uniref:Uncharacterized protein n=1 Tax=Aromia moschata TaxID=1265417 RepID=A0AAV8Z2B8_9CUCU|nr:hypothetical protein NQ318_007810 [Aromia moschata]
MAGSTILLPNYISYFMEVIYRRQPNLKLFRNLYNRLGQTGSFGPKNNHGTPKTITVDEDEILICVSENPGMSTRRLSAETGLSQSSICRILKKETLRPYHDTSVQQLLPQDLSACLQFTHFLQNMQTENPGFLNKMRYFLDGEFLIEETIICGITRIHMLLKKYIVSMSLR